MSKFLHDWCDFISTIKSLNIQLVTLDIRGTLIKAPREGNLKRVVLKQWKGRGKWIDNVDKEVSKLVLEKYGERYEATDWTLVTLLELRDFAQSYGMNIDSVDAQTALQSMVDEYTSKSVPLVEDPSLARFIQGCQAEGILVAIAADGLFDRERRVFQSFFPLCSDLIDGFYTSETIGVNKLSPDYYKRLVKDFVFLPNQMIMIGDRIDKDIKVPSMAGCHTILISSTHQETSLQIKSMKVICPQSI